MRVLVRVYSYQYLLFAWWLRAVGGRGWRRGSEREGIAPTGIALTGMAVTGRAAFFGLVSLCCGSVDASSLTLHAINEVRIQTHFSPLVLRALVRRFQGSRNKR